MSYRCRSCWISLVIVLGAGCGRGTYPVAGKIVYADGAPAKELVNGSVSFEMPGAKMSARGTIQEDATFELYTYKLRDGALPGQYRVAVRAGPYANPAVLDRRFTSFETSGLEVNVKAKSNEITLIVEKATVRQKTKQGKEG